MNNASTRGLRFARWAGAAAVAMLPVWPEAFGAVVIVIGLVKFRWSRWPRLLLSVLAVAMIVGAAPQIGAALSRPLAPGFSPPVAPALVSRPPNRLQTTSLRTFYCFIWDVGSEFGEPLGDGFYRFYKNIRGKPGRTCAAIDFLEGYQGGNAASGAFSFYYRLRGKSVTITPTGGKALTLGTTNGAISRAAFQVRNAASPSAFRFGSLSGDWISLDIGFPQLESGAVSTPYIPAWPTPIPPWVTGAGAWILAALGLAVGITGATVLISPLSRIEVAWAVLAGLAGTTIFAVIQYAQFPGRVQGLTSNPNFLGHLAAMAACLIVATGTPALGATGLVLGVLVALLSGTRAAMYGLAVAAVLLFANLVRDRRSAAWKPLALAFTLIAGVLAIAPGRLSQLFDFVGGTFEARRQIWNIAWQAFLEHPWTGIGFGQFAAYYTLHAGPTAADRFVPYAHNIFLTLLSEGGLPALIAFLSFFGVVAVVLLRRRAWGGLAVLTCAIVLNLADSTFWSGVVYYPLIAGLALTGIIELPQRPVPPRRGLERE